MHAVDEASNNRYAILSLASAYYQLVSIDDYLGTKGRVFVNLGNIEVVYLGR